jgi:protein-L-isoaspartate(D-aspartate) O-methyltransferase
MTPQAYEYGALVGDLADRGLLSTRWREVWERVPRAAFIPPRIWRQQPDRCVPVTTEAARTALVHSDEPVITQLDDGQPEGPGIATSSNSKPSMVAQMLGLLDVHDGDRILEIGSATGHVAALLSERLGDRNVVSVEIDPALSRQARENCLAMGYSPALVVADGEQGWAQEAPYDGIICTCALRHVPHELVQQVRPGGVIVTPLARDFWSGALVQLMVYEDTALGPFRGGASYMPMRSHRAVVGAPVDDKSARSSHTVLDPRQLLGLGFAIYAGARMPGVTMVHTENGGTVQVWLQDRHGSGAVAESGTDVWQYGPRSLWTEVEATHQEYLILGRPDADQFGLTVTSGGQHVWLTEPTNVITSALRDQ